jgi:hypothetical protein
MRRLERGITVRNKKALLVSRANRNTTNLHEHYSAGERNMTLAPQSLAGPIIWTGFINPLMGIDDPPLE